MIVKISRTVKVEGKSREVERREFNLSFPIFDLDDSSFSFMATMLGSGDEVVFIFMEESEDTFQEILKNFKTAINMQLKE